MSIIEKLDSIKDTIPHYWPIGSFIHHNPLKGFEDLHFKDGLKKAQAIFGGKVYMDAAYYMGLYEEGKIDSTIFENNIKHSLETNKFDISLELTKKFLMEVSPKWGSLRIDLLSKKEKVDEALYMHLKENSVYNDKNAWLAKLTKHMTLYEINDALFSYENKETIEKDIIEFVSRFLDENQTTMSMPNRELGMFEAFKLFEDFSYEGDAASYVTKCFNKLQVENEEQYLLTHLLKLHGWAGFIKYRSADADNASQEEYPTTLIEYMAIRMYYECEAVKHCRLSSFHAFTHYADDNLSDVLILLLKHKDKLFGPALDALEDKQDTSKVLADHIEHELNLDALQIQHSNDVLQSDLSLVELVTIINQLREEEGYIWLKSLEDSYMHGFVDSIIQTENEVEKEPAASITFCLDVRSEVMRRNVEASGPYQTYGAGGFLGLPITFVEFDKAHELFLAPAIVQTNNVVFELPLETHDAFTSKALMNKTTKKVLGDLKNNPYTPYIMVEAIGWIFGIKLFGQTFFPQKTKKFLSNFKPSKPKTAYTLDKLSVPEIEFYLTKLHTNIIHAVLEENTKKHYTDYEVELLRKHLVFGEKLNLDIAEAILEKLKSKYKITAEDYSYQKNKLELVGFTLEEKVKYLHNYLTMIGQVDSFPEFVILSGHGSVSDNNPFESALDCGACGGNLSLPNNRALCMIANRKEVREALLKEKGIEIPANVKFIPALHITSTDEVKYYDTDHLTQEEAQRLFKVMHDVNNASQNSREERIKALPYTHTQEDINIKSMDWSEPRPEWGLAGNMGAFAGPRDSIKHIKFDNRFFLHSYDHNLDNDNADILTRIFDGPLVVGEWINLEHYFSTVDNHIYGAGSKVYHNVVSKIGVYSGNYSDLKIGLPTQSVLLEGEAYHEPVRLITIMEAPLAKVGKAVENSLAKPFILNEWIRPVIIDKEAKKVYSYENGDFVVIREIK